ncbi:hypothetical protein [Parendozoicomonas haliclonae]|uniref:Uncharacterized protein n=1 Tax=Parendozoicomonas haliclonae TaxID=1960125 RepID=A0A1X7AFH8_9GAMM|nr:hypothetical protein [Parendozoicomonas haliclonae]SMA37477.1 hypothetical protein EHSB41UT_00743 [Parendozoicomonas haliclonae]
MDVRTELPTPGPTRSRPKPESHCNSRVFFRSICICAAITMPFICMAIYQASEPTKVALADRMKTLMPVMVLLAPIATCLHTFFRCCYPSPENE